MTLEESRHASAAPAIVPGGRASMTALRGTQTVSLTALQERWGSTLERDGTTGPRFDAAIRRVIDGDALADVDQAWVAFLARHVQVCAVYSQAVHDVLRGAATRCEWGPISRCLDVQAALQVRRAQTLVLFAIDLERALGALPLEEARARWEGTAEWQPTRRFLAKLALGNDWGEQFVAVNVCLEPLVDGLFWQGWGVEVAGAHGDGVSPILAEPTRVQSAWTRDWTREVLSALCARRDDGETNRATVEGWVAAWTPRATTAVTALSGLAAGLPVADAAALSLERVRTDHAEYLRDLDLAVPAGVTA